jgi:hypothetical protein
MTLWRGGVGLRLATRHPDLRRIGPRAQDPPPSPPQPEAGGTPAVRIAGFQPALPRRTSLRTQRGRKHASTIFQPLEVSVLSVYSVVDRFPPLGKHPFFSPNDFDDKYLNCATLRLCP